MLSEREKYLIKQKKKKKNQFTIDLQKIFSKNTKSIKRDRVKLKEKCLTLQYVKDLQ